MFGRGVVEQAQKLEPFLMPMLFLTESVVLAVGGIKGREQSRGAVALVVVGHGLAASPLEGQAGLGAVQGLDLAFFVHTQHQSVLGRAQIEADHIFQFLNKGGVVPDFETLHAMGLETVTAPDTAHAGGADPHRNGHGPRAPARGLRRGFACRHANHALDQTGAEAGLATGTGRIFLQSH